MAHPNPRGAKPNLLAGLNPEQLQAVETTAGPLLVLAGAGTGKTRVVTVRIAHMLQQGVEPEQVLAMTFTNKAAAEMRERVGALVGKENAERLTIGTFHSFCLRQLREHAGRLGFPEGFSICDAGDQLTALKGALRELSIPETSIQPGALQARISLAKNRLDDPERFLARGGDDRDELVGRAWRRYQSHLRRSRSMDFDDLLLETLRLYREHEDVRRARAERFRYVLVDEYQDTNGPQYEIVRALAGEHRNLCVVGDDDQSIYGWRGADVSKILGFEKDFPEAVVVRLVMNYRSTQQILDVAERVIRNNPDRHPKPLTAARGQGERLTAVQHADEDGEAEYVVRDITERVRHTDAHLGDFAILFRTATQPRCFEAELRARDVPYVLVGGMSFFDRKEVRDVLAYLRLVHNPRDEVSLLRIVNCPPRGVGKTTIERVVAFATEHSISASQAFDRASEIERANPAACEAVQRLRERLAALGKRYKGAELVALVERLLEEVSYETELERCYPDPQVRELRRGALDGLLKFAENHVRYKKRPSLATFLSDLTLNANDDKTKEDAEKREVVTLMTLHSAKGLEFPRVFLVGFEEGILPHVRAVAEDGVEEERRLAYVGITRARDALTISFVKERARFGTRVPVHPSRFFYELKGEGPPEGWIPAGGDPEAHVLTPKRARKKRRSSKKPPASKKPGSSKKRATRGPR